jgi:hypothetical protein
MPCPSCPILTILPQSCPCCHVLIVLYSVSSPGCSFLTVSPAVLSQLSCSSTLVPSSLVRPVFSLLSLSYPGLPVLSVLSRLLCQEDLYKLTCPGCPIPLSLLFSCPRCPVPTVLSWLSCYGCLVLFVIFQLECPCFCVWPACSVFLVLPVQSELSSPAVLYRFPLPVVLSQLPLPQHSSLNLFLFALSCLCCHVFVVLSNQHCPGSPGLEIQSRLSY